MKKILLAIVFCCSMNIVNAQSADNGAILQDSHHAIIGYVKRGGAIYDLNNVLVCQFKNNGNILNGNNQPLGYIIPGQVIQDANHVTIGYLKGAGFEDANHKLIGSVNNDGSIVKSDNTVIGYEINTEPMWAGLYFFMFKK